MIEFVEEAFDDVAHSVGPLVEARQVHPIWHELDIGFCAVRRGLGVGVVGTVRQQDIAAANGGEHVFGAAPVVRLAFGQLEKDR